MLPASMDNLLAKLSEQQAILEKQTNALKPVNEETANHQKADSSSGSVPLTPGSDSFSRTHSGDEKDNGNAVKPNTEEMARLKKELDAAKDQIARQKKELDQTRAIRHGLDQAASTSSDVGVGFNSKAGVPVTHPAPLNPGIRLNGMRQDTWSHNDDARSDLSDAISAGVLNTTHNMWSTSARPAFNIGPLAPTNQQFQQPTSTWGQPGARPWSHRPIGSALQSLGMPQQQHLQQRTFSGPASSISGTEGRAFGEFNQLQNGTGLRRSNTQNNRNSSLFPVHRNNGWDMYAGLDVINTAMNPAAAFQSVGMYPAAMQYQPRPIGTPLSPTAEEFRTTQPSATPWNVAVSFWICCNLLPY